jgi:hypothetical protein
MAALGGGPGFVVPMAYEAFIRFDHASVAAHWHKITRSHGFPNPVREKPSGFQGHAQGPVKLISAEALLATGH